MLIFRHTQWYSETIEKTKMALWNLEHQKLEDRLRSHMDLLRRHTLSSYPFDTKSMG